MEIKYCTIDPNDAYRYFYALKRRRKITDRLKKGVWASFFSEVNASRSPRAPFGYPYLLVNLIVSPDEPSYHLSYIQ